jgi:hypothetical protein
LSEACPQRHLYVQNAFACRDQYSDISTTSPEGINLDVIGYDLVNVPRPTPTPQPSATQCSILQKRLDRLQLRQQRLRRLHRSKKKLNQRIRRLRRQLQLQGCL